VTPLITSLKNGAASKGAASAEADPAQQIAEAAAEKEMVAALESKNAKRIRAALRRLRDLDED